MLTGKLGRMLFRVGYYSNSVEGIQRLGVTRNWFGRGKVIGIYGGGISLANERAMLRTMSDPSLSIADRKDYLNGIASGEIDFVHLDKLTVVKPALAELLKVTELKPDAQAAIDKLFPPPAFVTPKPASDGFGSPSLVALARQVGDDVAAAVEAGTAKPGEVFTGSEVQKAAEAEMITRFAAAEKAALAAIQGSDIDAARLAFKALLQKSEWRNPLLLMKAAANWNVSGGELSTEAVTMLNKLPLRIISGGRTGRVEQFLGDNEIAGLADIGGRKNQEDAMAILRHKDKTYLLVADGMGGHAKGEVASEMVIDNMIQSILDGEALPAAVAKAHDAVSNYGLGKKGVSRPGATISVVEIDNNNVTAAAVGDSPIYLVKEDGTVQLLALPHVSFVETLVVGTHSLPGGDSVALTVNKLKAEYLKNPNPPYSEELIEILLQTEREIRATYGGRDIGEALLALTHIPGHSIPAVSVVKVAMEGGDQLLVASDGLDLLPAQIKAIMGKKELTMAQKTNELVEAALRNSKKGDNVTVVGFEALTQVGDSAVLGEEARASAETAAAEETEDRPTIIYHPSAQQEISPVEMQLRARLDEMADQVARLEATRQMLEAKVSVLINVTDIFEKIRIVTQDVVTKYNELRTELNEVAATKKRIAGDVDHFKKQLAENIREVEEQAAQSAADVARAKQAAEAAFKTATSTTRILALRTEINHLKTSGENQRQLEFAEKSLANLESAAKNILERKLRKVEEEEAARLADREAQRSGNLELDMEIEKLEVEVAIMERKEAETAGQLAASNSEVEAYRKYFAGMVNYLDQPTGQ